MEVEAALAGVLLGTAVGDALGLPREGLPPARAARRFGGAPLTYRLIAGRGLVSDDTEHTCLVAQALLVAHDDPTAFALALGRELRWWFAGLPAGAGKATIRACLRLWRGVPPDRSGVVSAGNGPAMRAALLGVRFAGDFDLLTQFVAASTVITHRDPRALDGALAVALTAALGSRGATTADILAALDARLTTPELRGMVAQVTSHVQRGATAAEFAAAIGAERGVSGYIVPTVGAALFCRLRWPTDFRQAVEQVILLGGDADTTGAITGALCGAALGPDSIPPEWLTELWEWPRSVAWMRLSAHRLATGSREPLRALYGLVLLRNTAFLAVVLGHGLRRLWPW